MIKRKYLLIISISAVLLAGGVFGYEYFSSSSATKIEIKNEVAENDLQRGSTSLDQNDQKRSNLDEEQKNIPEKTVIEKTASTDKINIINNLVSRGYEKASSRKIDTIIIHSSYNSLGGDQFSLEKILDIYKSYGVAPHYIIDRSGKIYRLVADENITYHAGESRMPDGRTSVNNFSIGIELINSKTEKPTNDQYAALKKLIAQLKSEYEIKYVLGHNQIAPGRKDDPWNMDWSKVKK